jgi:tRNA pseudouridine55 synthase
MRFRPDKHRLPVYDRSGVLLVNKPKDWTSHDVVAFIRSRFNAAKCGHCGTLDPAATGLLVVVLGKFTKLSQKFSGQDKVYEGTILLGTETDSQDMDGNVIRQSDWSGITEQQLRGAFASFVGDIEQVPPMVSAVKKDGARLYELARKGQEVEREPKQISIYSIDVTRVALPYADFTVECSKGTYVRTLCADVGARLGCGAALYRLNRLRSGEFSLDDAVDIETVKQWTQDDLDNWVTGFLHNRLTRMSCFTGN